MEATLSLTTLSLVEQIKATCDDYYPTLAEGNICLGSISNNGEIQSICDHLNCTEQEAQDLIDSGLVAIDSYTCENPENDDKSLYLDTIHLVGTPVYYDI